MSLRSFLLPVLLAVATCSRIDLHKQMNAIAGSSQGRVGAAVLLLESGKSAEINGDERFPMQSVYKLPIAMAVLDRVDRGLFKLEQKVKVQKSELVPEDGSSRIDPSSSVTSVKSVFHSTSRSEAILYFSNPLRQYREWSAMGSSTNVTFMTKWRADYSN